MKILDTNVISELMRRAPQPAVVEWISDQIASELYITTITLAEISYGLAVLPKGKRRAALELAFKQLIQAGFEDRVLSFDQRAAFFYGDVMAQRKIKGKPMSALDGQIAAIALSLNAAVVTRNVKDFKNCHITTINPFSS
ncbi:MAG: type II toxin-antitoxin system VapC family toxin [Coxiellaceae bacterium]|nr:type II toxin-antitoxin system VapC family toxin [Coxiellaceae bacterium]